MIFPQEENDEESENILAEIFYSHVKKKNSDKFIADLETYISEELGA